MSINEKRKIAIRTWSMVLLPICLTVTWPYDKSFVMKLIVYAVIVLSIATIASKLLFLLEKKKVWLYEKRCKMIKSKSVKNVVTFIDSFITIMVVYHLRYIDYTLIIVVCVMAGLLLALTEFFTTIDEIKDYNAKFYEDDWWKDKQTTKDE